MTNHCVQCEQHAAYIQELQADLSTSRAVSAALQREISALQAEVKRLVSERDAIRPVVRWFAAQMERKLRANDHKGGWSEMSAGWLIQRCQDELDELDREHDPGRQVEEAVDVANFAMMIADNASLRAVMEDYEKGEE